MLTGKTRFNGEIGGLVACLLLPPLLTASPPAWGGTAQEPGTLLDLVYFLQQCLNALQVSTFYGLLAAAYVLIYGITRRINLAFGALAMWGGYLVVLGVMVIFAVTPLGLPASALLALAYALGATALLGWVLQRTLVLPLLGRPSLALLILTIGLAIVLEEVLRLAQGNRERWLQPLLDDPLLAVEGAGFVLQLTVMRGLIVLAALGLGLGLLLFLARHRFGRRWRACAQDHSMAALCGVDVGATLALSFALASLYAAAAGAIIAFYYGNVSFYMGTVLGLKALLAAVIGGLTSVGGALLGGLLLGCLESFWSAYFPVAYRDPAVLGILILIMIVRPQGLLAPAEAQDREAV